MSFKSFRPKEPRWSSARHANRRREHGLGRLRAPHLLAAVALVLALALVFAVRDYFTGASPRRTGVDPELIEPMQASIGTGTVLSEDGAPLALAQVTVRDRSGHGDALTDAQGGFAMAVNSEWDVGRSAGYEPP